MNQQSLDVKNYLVIFIFVEAFINCPLRIAAFFAHECTDFALPLE